MWKLNNQWWRPYRNRNHKFRTQMWDQHIETKLLQSNNNLNRQSFHEHQQEIESNPRVLGNLYPKIAQKRRMWWFRRNFLYKFSESGRSTYLTKSTVVSISNCQKTNLYSYPNLSWRYNYFFWPINHVSEVKFFELWTYDFRIQLMNSIIPRS